MTCRSRPERGRDNGGHPQAAPVSPAASPTASVGERGAAAISHTVVIATSMILFVLCANVIVVVYARGVVRSALDEGVRAGARAAAGVAECQQRVDDVLGQLLGGSIGLGVTATCEDAGDRVVATADAAFPGWLPGVPEFRFRIAAAATKRPEAGAVP
jgi:hypothetical protein